ncbi:alkaline phosphatase [Streptomyces sp. yr375]|uniref:alkaline phosphatase D family protein n=1 Tax=Streptomyces sp. yr375 TaxID=1761906 RepID=UPI000B88726F|nr:alkaline phosphatase D family protein [Streptomyces sp. yr375]
MTPAARPSPYTPAYTPELRATARHLGRRRFLGTAAAAAALAFTVNLPAAGTAAAAELDPARLTDDPFTLGVASGDPLPGSVLLWTRLAPAPYQADGGLPAERVTVHWELADDDTFGRSVRSGTTLAHPEFGHSVHVQVDGLDDDRVYYYRFKAGTWISRTGRTRTAPAPGADASALTLGVVSCQRYDQGYFTAYKHLAEDDVDVVLHLGDYLYEYAVSGVGGARAYPAGTVPAVYGHEMVTLDDYRLKYALYKSDPDLLAAHSAHPFVVTWDDHETENNYAGAVSENDDPAAEFLIRRAAAYRAYWENQPLRRPQLPDGPDLRLYRRLHWGRLAQLDVLDTRQYRSDQAYGDGWQFPGPESEDPARTLTGDAQERWLIDGWRDSAALWNVVPQQVTFARRYDSTALPARVSMDSWDGYPASRTRILAGAEATGVENLMVLTGDVHVHYGFDVKRDFADPASKTLGTEIVTSSISSGGNGTARPANWAAYLAANPHLKFYNGLRGYARVTLGRDLARADFKTVPYVTRQGAPLSTAASFVTEVGAQGLKPA